jgi:hypothetical protein
MGEAGGNGGHAMNASKGSNMCIEDIRLKSQDWFHHDFSVLAIFQSKNLQLIFNLQSSIFNFF